MRQATDIVKKPNFLEHYEDKYMIIYEPTIVGGGYGMNNLDSAICIMAKNGWKPISITSHFDSSMMHTYVYVLMEKIGFLPNDLNEDNKGNTEDKTIEDLSERIPCSDENCTGILNEQGYCGVCGKKCE
jgi:hypothetical protein